MHSKLSVKLLTSALLLSCASFAAAADLIVYSSGPGSLAKKLASNFEKKTGVHVRLFASSTGKVMARLAAEAAHPQADVVILANWTAGLNLAQQGNVLTYRPEKLVQQLRPQLNADGPFLPIGGDVVSIVVNNSIVKEDKIPHDWFDLTAPQWNKKLTMPDPTLSGTASDFVIAFIDHQGSKGWEWFQQLKANGCIWPGANASALRPVQMGGRSLMVAGVAHTALKAKKRGNSLELVFPTSGVLMIPRPIIVLKSSKQISEAKRFVDYTFTVSAQQEVAKSLLIPAVRGVKPADIWPNMDSVKILAVDWTKLAAKREVILTRFRREILGH